MGKIVVSEFVTLDNVMEGPGTDKNFDRCEWAFNFNRGDEGDKYKLDELMAADALLLGRITYEGFAAAWPTIDAGEFSEKMNGMRKYVFSSTITDPKPRKMAPVQSIASLVWPMGRPMGKPALNSCSALLR